MIRHAKDWLEDHLSRSATPLKTTDFNWVITVPAIWQARGRGMMREAAYMVNTDIFTMIKIVYVLLHLYRLDCVPKILL